MIIKFIFYIYIVFLNHCMFSGYLEKITNSSKSIINLINLEFPFLRSINLRMGAKEIIKYSYNLFSFHNRHQQEYDETTSWMRIIEDKRLNAENDIALKLEALFNKEFEVISLENTFLQDENEKERENNEALIIFYTYFLSKLSKNELQKISQDREYFKKFINDVRCDMIIEAAMEFFFPDLKLLLIFIHANGFYNHSNWISGYLKKGKEAFYGRYVVLMIALLMVQKDINDIINKGSFLEENIKDENHKINNLLEKLEISFNLDYNEEWLILDQNDIVIKERLQFIINKVFDIIDNYAESLKNEIKTNDENRLWSNIKLIEKKLLLIFLLINCLKNKKNNAIIYKKNNLIISASEEALKKIHHKKMLSRREFQYSMVSANFSSLRSTQKLNELLI